MNAARPSEISRFVPRLTHVILCGLLALVAMVPLGIASFFMLSSDAAALRESAMAGTGGHWKKTIALNIGWATTGLARAGSQFFKLAPEPRAALDSIRAGEVGIYKLQGAAGRVDHGAVLARADKAMSARRWDRIVGVSQDGQLVAVYVPKSGLSTEKVRCCVLVLNDRDLVIAGGRANIEPLLSLAREHVDFREATKHFALR